MSAAWSVLVIVFGGIVACVVYVALTGAEHVRGAERLIDGMRDRDGAP